MRAVPLISTLALLPALLAAQTPPPPWGPQSYDETIKRARNLAREQPQTQWEQLVDALSADLIEFIAPDRILIGLVRTTRLGEPRYDDVSLVNASDGATLWSAKRDQIALGAFSVLAARPLILLLGSNEGVMSLTALDTASGRQVWQYRARAPYTLARASDRVLVLGKQGSGRRLEAIDAATGRVLWRSDFDARAIPDSASATLLVAGDTAFVSSGMITAIDARTGAVLATITPAQPAPEGMSVQLVANGSALLVRTARRLELIDRASGASRWTLSDSVPTQLIAVQPGAIVRVTQRGTRGVVERLRLSDGSRQWRYEGGGPVVSPVASVNDLVLFAQDSALVGLDTATGAPRIVTRLPAEVIAAGPSFARRIGVPDMLELRTGRLYLSRERAGITAFELPSGRLLWSQPIYERPQPAFDYTAQGRYEFLLQNLALVGRAPPRGPGSMSIVSQAPKEYSLLESAQNEYQAARTRYDALRTDPTATREQRAAAADRLQFAAEQNLAATQINVSLGRMQASMAFGAAMLGAALQFAAQQKIRIQEGLVDRVQMMLQGAMRAQQRVFQGDYYVRPFYKRGRGVTLVSLETGRRRDIVISPHSEPLNAFGVDLPVFTIGGGANPRLVALGISMHPDRYVERSLGKSKLPTLSLLAYDVGSISLIERTRDWGWLIDFIRAGDEASLRRALAAGDVDVNARHWAAGEPALIWAVALGRLDFARILIENGANVNLVSDIGMTAVDVARTDEMRTYLRSVGGKTAAELPTPP